ncbi:hypothetical protein RhiirA1_449813 [Rhizophagus irregularis]|uniref:Uncharacterized protein n=1 Tax=Rhizophagus irregularis TaxID=588596 RepID=A0A2N0SGB1_9GLOM|nr:hypothetical protein RhiirA1_449813 [Rhizophagus irregularis]
MKLPEKAINVEKLGNAFEAYFNFLTTWKTTILRKVIIALKNKMYNISFLLYFIWISYRKSLNNKLKAKLDKLKLSGFQIYNYKICKKTYL